MNGVHFVLGSPNAYIHEPGILRKAGEWVGKYGKSMFIVSGEKSWSSCKSRLTSSLDEAGIRYEMHPYRGEKRAGRADQTEEIFSMEEGLLIALFFVLRIVGVLMGTRNEFNQAVCNRNLLKEQIAVPVTVVTGIFLGSIKICPILRINRFFYPCCYIQLS